MFLFDMKTWVVVLLIGIAFLIGGFVLMSPKFGFTGMPVIFIGVALIVGAIVAAARRLMRRMMND
jgi:Kef-type K+ transport system membrane component KefB